MTVIEAEVFRCRESLFDVFLYLIPVSISPSSIFPCIFCSYQIPHALINPFKSGMLKQNPPNLISIHFSELKPLIESPHSLTATG